VIIAKALDRGKIGKYVVHEPAPEPGQTYESATSS
jgi:hypothetical protein